MATKACYMLVLCCFVAMEMHVGECSCPRGCVCVSAQQLKCDRSGLRHLPRRIPRSSTTIDLSHNEIIELTVRDMRPMSGIVNFKIKANKVEYIENGAFVNMSSLQTLDMSNNVLKTIHAETFKGAAKLLHLDISGNELDSVDGGFVNLQDLTRLDLRNNKIERLTQFTFRDLVSLRYLLLSGNQVNFIDLRTFVNLERLMYVVFKKNPLHRLTRFEFHSRYLSYIDLSECSLPQMPKGLPNSLRYLQLRRNNITVIDKNAFLECPWISILVLDENGIQDIETKAFDHMIYLQQLWLNSNNLSYIPLPLPPSLQRLLMDSNKVRNITDIFPAGSKIQTLSFMGNNISYLSWDSLHKLTDLRSLDLSDNKIEKLYSHTFFNSSRLEKLQLSKNPLKHFHHRSLHGLLGLQTLSLAYIHAGLQTMHHNVFEDLTQLQKLDLDSSPDIVQHILSSSFILQPLSNLEDLSMQRAEISTLRSDFSDFFPHLKNLHISSTRWHCDKSLVWFKDWLISTSVAVADKNTLLCFSPSTVYAKPIMSLSNSDFVAVTTIRTTTKRWWKVTTPTLEFGQLVTTPASRPVGSPLDWDGVKSSTPSPGGNVPPWEANGFEASGLYTDYDEDGDSEGLPSGLFRGNNPFDWPFTSEKSLVPSPTPSVSKAPSGGRPRHNTVDIRTVPWLTTTDRSKIGASSEGGFEGDTSNTIIIVATSLSGFILLMILMFIVAYLCRRQKSGPKPENYGNSIKYKHRNDVLYFMPHNGTDGSMAESVQSTASKERMALVPGRDINHEGPLRVYKWEDF